MLAKVSKLEAKVKAPSTAQTRQPLYPALLPVKSFKPDYQLALIEFKQKAVIANPTTSLPASTAASVQKPMPAPNPSSKKVPVPRPKVPIPAPTAFITPAAKLASQGFMPLQTAPIQNYAKANVFA